MDELIIIGGLKYQLHKNNYTATVINSLHIISHLIIPRSIVYESQEYIITTVQKNSFLYDKKLISIKFDEDSEVHTIEQNSFSDSSLTSIFFPASIENLKGFADSNTKINYVSISPKNKNFKVISNSLIIGKSDQNSDIFDSLFFVSRNSKKVTVPPFIKYVSSYSFSSCKTLNQVIFTEDSQLMEIECDAFCLSSIQSINFPPKLKILHEGWCNYTRNLKYVKISPKNTNFCYLDSNQNVILGKTDLNQQFFDVIVFGSRSLKQVTIPYYIKRINESAFSECTFLEKVEISEDSELESIGSNSFFRTSISEIFIPKHVKSIESFALNTAEKLSIINFAEDSELELIDDSAFVGSRLDKVVEIPTHVKEIKNFVFNQCELINSIIFKENAEIELFGECSFLNSNLTSILIPKSLKIISAHAFLNCEQLKYVQFQKDSQLELIDKSAFARTIIEELEIPKHVKTIGKKAFQFCNFLEMISFEEGSEINSICKRAFFGSAISFLEIPENLVDLQDGWCDGTENLDMIQISPKNKKFIFLNGEMIISKSDINNQSYDTLVFVSRSVENVNIPSFIKCIDPFAFHGTLEILNLEFPEDSQLLVIEKNAFNYSGIESLHIPEKVQELKDGWCNFTTYLNRVSISEKNNNLCLLPSQEKIILSKSNNEQEIFDVISFACRDVNKVIIPNYIKYINSGAFCECNYLVYVDFEENSELQFIGENCFEKTSIKNICTPKKLEKIGKSSFFSCMNLYSFESLSEKFDFTQFLFNNTENLNLLSFPNAKRIYNIKIVSNHSSIYNQINFFVKNNAIID